MQLHRKKQLLTHAFLDCDVLQEIFVQHTLMCTMLIYYQHTRFYGTDYIFILNLKRGLFGFHLIGIFKNRARLLFAFKLYTGKVLLRLSPFGFQPYIQTIPICQSLFFKKSGLLTRDLFFLKRVKASIHFNIWDIGMVFIFILVWSV